MTLADKSVEAAQDVRELNRKLTSEDSTIGRLIGSRDIYDKGLSLLTRADNSVKAIEEITSRVNNGDGTLGKAINEKELYERLNPMSTQWTCWSATSRKTRPVTLSFRFFEYPIPTHEVAA